MKQRHSINSLIILAILILSLQSCSSPVTYKVVNNDVADIKLTLNPDKTLTFYFKSFDEPDSSGNARETIFESTGTWQKVGGDIEVKFSPSKENFNYKVVFENERNTSVTVNDRTFRFDLKRDTIVLWGIEATKN
jgi:hypothetical protein